MFNPEVTELAKVIWGYLQLHQTLVKSDLMLVLGSHDLRVPAYAAELYGQGYASMVVVSGGIAHHDDLLKTTWQGTEAEKFAQVMVAHGVSEEVILIEGKATNTGENFSLSRQLLEGRSVVFSSVLVVTKPYMERRAFATGTKQWPNKSIVVASPPVSFEEYFGVYANQDTTPDDVLHIMMGDLQRIDLYGKNGFQIPQEIPPDVWAAFLRLRDLGYTKRLVI